MKTLLRFLNWFILWRSRPKGHTRLDLLSRRLVAELSRQEPSKTIITKDGRLSVEGREHITLYGTTGVTLKRKAGKEV